MSHLTPTQRTLLAHLLTEQELEPPPAWAADQLAADVRAELERRLPAHLIPRQFAVLPAFPLTANGKVDTTALPDPSPAAATASALPRTDLERDILAVFREVLNRADLGIHDDFFLMGGDSLLATELGAKLRERLGVTLPVALMFSSPTAAGVAAGVALAQRTQPTESNLLDLSEFEADDTDLEQSTDLLRADVNLAADIQPAPGAEAKAPEQWRAVFLTGATGFFGSHLLAELLETTNLTVHCLVRAESEGAALERLRAAQRRFCPDAVWDERRVLAHPGDLTSLHFGLGEAGFSALADEVDALFHAGATVNFAYAYATLKPSNVDACADLFRLAVRGHLKPVHFVSTIHLFSSSRLLGRARIPETEDIDALPTVTGGYAQSRWVAESVARQACGRGIPVTVYRPSVIGGDTRTGVSNENDALCRLLRGCVQLGVAPSIRSGLNIVSADYAAAGLVHLALNEASQGQTYHLVNPESSPLNDIFEYLRASGYPLATTDYGDWQARIEAAGPENSLYTLLPLIAHLGVAEATGLRPPHFDGAQAVAQLAPQGLTCPPVTADLIRFYLSGMVKSGFLPLPSAGKS
ncbi:NAD-dependent epimerase/dehydratase family protein [Deinococcus sp. Arct2-2]|uniref:thioester reductase domain-containing protein n=1 Tax=Deinococcus sp. Arct2-2 TaxID=2568653 RepID=UPI0010A4DCAF|nr:thioester reductase domain-containing protein [Deinococcus sp. Arct2-2]THF70279.1 NAD-dependent epimerase/dehydratase family protein [Deinococcus sp. Arct2-2]